MTLDVTDQAQIDAAAETVESLDVLINNAGVAAFDDLSDRAVVEQHLAVNVFGPLSVTQALLPQLAGSRGAIVNVLSLASVAFDMLRTTSTKADVMIGRADIAFSCFRPVVRLDL